MYSHLKIQIDIYHTVTFYIVSTSLKVYLIMCLTKLIKVFMSADYNI